MQFWRESLNVLFPVGFGEQAGTSRLYPVGGTFIDLKFGIKTLLNKQLMENIPVLSNRLDESNGIVEHVLEMKAKKTPWHLRFAPKAKGLVSFVQNLLSP